MRRRLGGDLLTYLGSATLCLVFALAGVYQELRAATDDAPAQPVARLAQAVVLALVLALFSIPIRLLLGLFPEPSSSTGVRFVRRCMLGAMVGPIPVLVVLLLGGREAKLEELIPIAMLGGFVVGLMDSIVRDHEDREARALADSDE